MCAKDVRYRFWPIRLVKAERELFIMADELEEKILRNHRGIAKTSVSKRLRRENSKNIVYITI